MIKKVLTILIIFLTTVSSGQDPLVLHKGDSSPTDGLLFSEKKAAEVKTQLIERDQLQLLNDSLNKSIQLYKSNEDLYQQKINILSDQNNTLAKTVYDQQSASMWSHLLWFALGVTVVGISVYGARQLTK